MSTNINRKRYGVVVIVLSSILLFALFALLGFNGTVITATSSMILFKLFVLLGLPLLGCWIGLSLYANKRTATQIVMSLVIFLIVSIAIGYLRAAR